MRNRVEHLGAHLILDDAYNANPTSMLAALDTLAALPGPRIAVLGDMLELGSLEAAAHIEVLGAALSRRIDRILVTGARMTAAARPGVEVYADADALAAALSESLPPSSSLLIKGSRGARMERVLTMLRKTVGRT